VSAFYNGAIDVARLRLNLLWLRFADGIENRVLRSGLLLTAFGCVQHRSLLGDVGANQFRIVRRYVALEARHP
jgi:hypothetical protein